MLTDAEFVLAKTFDAEVARNTGNAQAIINRKNSIIVRLEAEVLRLRRELQVEAGKRKLAEYKATRRH